MTERILYVGPLSLFSRKVEIALREKGLLYARELVPFTQAQGYSPKHPAVLAGNPLKKVPVLVEGDLTLFDSTVILEYLEETQPNPLHPSDPLARAEHRAFIEFGSAILNDISGLYTAADAAAFTAKAAALRDKFTRVEARLNERRTGLVQRDLRVEDVEERRRAQLVPALLHAKVFLRCLDRRKLDLHTLLGAAERAHVLRQLLLGEEARVTELRFRVVFGDARPNDRFLARALVEERKLKREAHRFRIGVAVVPPPEPAIEAVAAAVVVE